MNFIKQLFSFYINASIHVAITVYAFVRITELYFGLPYYESLDYFIFYGTITGYNFVKYAGVAKFYHRNLTKNLKTIQVFSFFCFIAMSYYAYLLPLKIILYAIPFTLFTILYAVPFLNKFQKNLRNLPYIKIIIVAFVWTGFTVFLPLVAAKSNFSTHYFIYGIQRFLIVIVLILPFEIRDIQYDAISLQTIPQRIGVPKTKKIGLTLMVLVLFIEYLITSKVATKSAFMLAFFLIILFLMRARVQQSKYYSSFWVEAVPLIWWLFLLGFHNF